jgi:hypothetical protein
LLLSRWKNWHCLLRLMLRCRTVFYPLVHFTLWLRSFDCEDSSHWRLCLMPSFTTPLWLSSCIHEIAVTYFCTYFWALNNYSFLISYVMKPNCFKEFAMFKHSLQWCTWQS